MGGLFEFEDKHWFPEVLRKMQVEYIGWLAATFKIYACIESPLYEALHNSRNTNITDLCSGNGGPIKFLLATKKLNNVTATLTDLFPVESADTDRISKETKPVNALKVPEHLQGLRTMFNAFHHFNESEKRNLIEQQAGNGFFVAEILQPDPLVFLKILFTTTIGQLLLTPFVKPFGWKRIALTYLIPINIITVTWDGLVSVLKSERPSKMEDRLKHLNLTGVRVRSGVSGAWWARISWFYVIPLKP